VAVVGFLWTCYRQERKTHTHSRTPTHQHTHAHSPAKDTREGDRQKNRTRERQRQRERERGKSGSKKGQPGVTTIQGMGNMQPVHSTDVGTQMSTPKQVSAGIF